MIPNHNDDPCQVADWISGTGFPLDEEEKYILDLVKETRYTSEPNHVERLYSLRILYWQVVGWIRGRTLEPANEAVNQTIRAMDTVEAIKQGREGVWDEEES